MTVGMDLKAVFEEGTIYTRDMLSVDEVARLQQAHRQALNLAVFAAYPTKTSLPFLLSKAYSGLIGVGGKLKEEAQSDKLKEALSARAAAASAAASAAPAGAAKEEEKEEEKGPSEEEAMAGLGSLFG
jgi:large subunit ribosomal protein L10